MVRLIISIIIVGIASSAPSPMLGCDKLVGKVQGMDNNNMYKIMLRNPNNLYDAEQLIKKINFYQQILELNSFTAIGSPVKSQLQYLEDVGLHGTLSNQALHLVCLEQAVKSIEPDYPAIQVEDPATSGDGVFVCSKLAINEPFNGNDYSVIFKPRTSIKKMYEVLNTMKTENQQDSVAFKYHYIARIGNKITMVAHMNIKAIEIICQEPTVQRIESNHDISIIRKRQLEPEACSLEERDSKHETYIITYDTKDAEVMNYIIAMAKEATPGEVLSAIPLPSLSQIIFTMSREAYLQACQQSTALRAEYDSQFGIPVNQPTGPPTGPLNQPNPPPTDPVAVCASTGGIDDGSVHSYLARITNLKSVERKINKCSTLSTRLIKKSSRSEAFVAEVSEKSCQDSNGEVKIIARMNKTALKFLCEKKNLKIVRDSEQTV